MVTLVPHHIEVSILSRLNEARAHVSRFQPEVSIGFQSSLASMRREHLRKIMQNTHSAVSILSRLNEARAPIPTARDPNTHMFQSSLASMRREHPRWHLTAAHYRRFNPLSPQ